MRSRARPVLDDDSSAENLGGAQQS